MSRFTSASNAVLLLLRPGSIYLCAGISGLYLSFAITGPDMDRWFVNSSGTSSNPATAAWTAFTEAFSVARTGHVASESQPLNQRCPGTLVFSMHSVPLAAVFNSEWLPVPPHPFASVSVK